VAERHVGWWVGGAAIFAGAIALSYYYSRPETPQQIANRLQKQITEIRGVPYKRPVMVEVESPDEFRKSLAVEIKRARGLPNFEQVARMLGFLARDEDFDWGGVQTHFLAEDVDSFYDCENGRLSLMQMTPGPRSMRSEKERDTAYVRELYRALQDQYFDLGRYLAARTSDSAFNEDQWLARRLVVEGEANYAAILWRLKMELGRVPDHSQLYVLARPKDRELSFETISGLLSDPRMRKAVGARRPMDAGKPKSVPSFLSELQKSVLRYGVAFVYDVHSRGWSELEKLYKESPPVSTAQILHPEKWFNYEQPVQITYPSFETNKAFADWELLAHNVLGELQWRVVFKTQHLSPIMSGAPAGWNGDRYAVFRRRGGEDMLMLMYTVWDTENAAKDFAASYRVLLDEKYLGTTRPPLRILEDGHRVVIVEGGDEPSLDTFMSFAASAQETEFGRIVATR
jgi:hypothetical protein